MYKHILSVVFLLVCLAVFTGCNTEKKKLKQKIEETEAKKEGKNPETIALLNQLYEEYADKFKTDTLAPLYLYKAAENYQYLGNYHRCIEMLDVFEERYPQHRLAPDALFFKAYVYETLLQDIPRAKQAYEKLIANYPQHHKAAIAKENLPYVGTLPEWVKEIIDSTGQQNIDTPVDMPADTEKTN